MSESAAEPRLVPETAPLAVVMISFNEARNMEAILKNLAGFAREIFLVDSYSTDATVDIALAHGVQVVQRPFKGFGDQWNHAVTRLPVTAPWTMKLDPDERLTDALKDSIRTALADDAADGFVLRRRLWFMGRPIPVRQPLLRIWRTGLCRFSKVTVNEHPMVDGRIAHVVGDLDHHDSANLHHWCDKQNRYTTAEALAVFGDAPLSTKQKLFGTTLERRMWFKAHFTKLPLRYMLLHLYHLVALGAWRAGATGFAWARLRTEVYRMIDLKTQELERMGGAYALPEVVRGAPHPRARQATD